MGRMLGSFDDDAELDRPDLNKCPDCGCFFPQDNCPLCGKPCPEEMRAGNRKAVKQKKKRRSTSDRIVFVEWYHSWWFIILMLIFFPLVGIALLITSPHKKSLKIAVVAVGVLYTIVSSYGVGTIVQQVNEIFDRPVNTSLSRDEYIAACESITAEAYYRGAEAYNDAFVSMTLTVTERITSGDKVYYLCVAPDGGTFELLIRDCIQDRAQNFLPGDRITIYGEGAESCTVYASDYRAHTAPCVNVAYVALGGS